ncbi:MAG: hypothetical protein CMF50_07125 [Legionellales bacterium]|nr:hypothetical protein [Legionellales bacterium]|tara:strand:- start:6463 stop:9366 length:2904 start_codon:yes stop_codon:yes gene_type:complete
MMPIAPQNRLIEHANRLIDIINRNYSDNPNVQKYMKSAGGVGYIPPLNGGGVCFGLTNKFVRDHAHDNKEQIDRRIKAFDRNTEALVNMEFADNEKSFIVGDRTFTLPEDLGSPEVQEMLGFIKDIPVLHVEQTRGAYFESIHAERSFQIVVWEEDMSVAKKKLGKFLFEYFQHNNHVYHAITAGSHIIASYCPESMLGFYNSNDGRDNPGRPTAKQCEQIAHSILSSVQTTEEYHAGKPAKVINIDEYVSDPARHSNLIAEEKFQRIMELVNAVARKLQEPRPNVFGRLQRQVMLYHGYKLTLDAFVKNIKMILADHSVQVTESPELLELLGQYIAASKQSMEEPVVFLNETTTVQDLKADKHYRNYFIQSMVANADVALLERYIYPMIDAEPDAINGQVNSTKLEMIGLLAECCVIYSQFELFDKVRHEKYGAFIASHSDNGKYVSHQMVKQIAMDSQSEAWLSYLRISSTFFKNHLYYISDKHRQLLPHDAQGITLVQRAALKNNVKALEFIFFTKRHGEKVERGVNLSEIYKDKENNLDHPLMLAARSASVEAFAWLLNYMLDKGMDVNMTMPGGNHIVFSIFNRGIGEGRRRYLLQRFLETISPDTKDHAGKTLLERAIEERDLVLVKMLIEKDADVNIADAEGNTLLHRVARRGDFELVVALVEGGANVDALNNENLPAAQVTAWAAYSEHREHYQGMHETYHYLLALTEQSALTQEFLVSLIHFRSELQPLKYFLDRVGIDGLRAIDSRKQSDLTQMLTAHINKYNAMADNDPAKPILNDMLRSVFLMIAPIWGQELYVAPWAVKIVNPYLEGLCERNHLTPTDIQSLRGMMIRQVAQGNQGKSQEERQQAIHDFFGTMPEQIKECEPVSPTCHDVSLGKRERARLSLLKAKEESKIRLSGYKERFLARVNGNGAAASAEPRQRPASERGSREVAVDEARRGILAGAPARPSTTLPNIKR